MKLLLSILTALLAICPIYQAVACTPFAEGWNYRSHRTDIAEETGEQFLILLGQSESFFVNENVEDYVAVSVSQDGRDIAGRLEHSISSGTLVWRADEPIEAGFDYNVVVKTGLQWDQAYREETAFVATWTDQSSTVGDIEFTAITPEGYSKKVYGDCIDESEVNSCGDCEREITGTEAYWRVEVGVRIAREQKRFIAGRIAVGVNADAALGALETASFATLSIQDAAYLQVVGGAQQAWENNQACVAVEIARPNGTPVFEGVECFDVPRTQDDAITRPGATDPVSGNIEDGRQPTGEQINDVDRREDEQRTDEMEGTVEDNLEAPASADAQSGGCSMTSNGASHSGAFIFMLCMVLGYRLRRI